MPITDTTAPQNNTAELEKPSKEVQGTNLDTAYFRSFSDIPNAKVVSELVHAPEAMVQRIQDEGLENTIPIIPYFEARYKALDALITQRGITQVVEFAAGRTTRGLNNPQWNYIYTDQDLNSLNQMKGVAKQLLTDQNASKLPFVRFDAITGEGLEEVMELLNDDKVAIIHEGLITYYGLETKAKIALNAKKILERFGGIYATPDVHTKSFRSDILALNTNMEQRERNRSKRVGRDLSTLRFEDKESAAKFYSELGFKVTTHKFGELVPKLSSSEALIQDPEKLALVNKTMLENREIWEMTLP
jgi:O-methyltransferase involved in polyketide biosynthesis